jgi:hypothetical protein
MNAVRLGQIVVRDVSETTLRTAFPDCEIAAVGADLQITFELRDLAETYPLLNRVRQTGATLVSLDTSPSAEISFFPADPAVRPRSTPDDVG